MRRSIPWLISAAFGASLASYVTWNVSTSKTEMMQSTANVQQPYQQTADDSPRKIIRGETTAPVSTQTANNAKATAGKSSAAQAPAAVSFAAAVAKASPAVVDFRDKAVELPGSSGLPNLDNDSQSNSLGSGVIMNAEGYLLTNNHVISASKSLEAILNDGRRLDVKIIGHDPETDLAVLKVNAKNLPVIEIARSAKLNVGDLVMAIGHPYGLGQAVSMGIVSALGRSGLNLSTFEDFIQTDAAINRGSSGGALINSNGEMVGISTAIITESGGSQGIGFAIPALSAEKVMLALIESGRVKRGWLGILPESMTLNDSTGVRVKRVALHTPASKAGLKVGDIIIQVGDAPVGDEYDALKAVSSQPPGTQVPLHIIRGDKQLKLTVEVSERPQPPN